MLIIYFFHNFVSMIKFMNKYYLHGVSVDDVEEYFSYVYFK